MKLTNFRILLSKKEAKESGCFLDSLIFKLCCI